MEKEIKGKLLKFLAGFKSTKETDKLSDDKLILDQVIYIVNSRKFPASAELDQLFDRYIKGIENDKTFAADLVMAIDKVLSDMVQLAARFRNIR